MNTKPKMSKLFTCFCFEMSVLCEHGQCSNRKLRRIASYFWNRLTKYYKTEWKITALEYNQSNILIGKMKRRGFWQFAKALQQHMQHCDVRSCNLFNEIWQNLHEEEQLKWMYPGNELVNYEVYNVI